MLKRLGFIFSAMIVVAAHVGAANGGVGFGVNGVAKIFNDTSSKIGGGLRAIKGKCEHNMIYSCNYQIGKSVIMLATSDKKEGEVSSFIIIYLGKSEEEIIDYFTAINVIMSALAPKAAVEEREDAFTILIEKFSDRSEGSVELHDVKVNIRLRESLGLWTTITKS